MAFTSKILLSTCVEIGVSAENLKSKDAFGKSDAVCILYAKDLEQNIYIEIDRTEQINNNPSPKWMKKFEIEYKFEEKQILQFRVYDWDTKSTEVKGQDLIGEIECTLAEIMCFQGIEVKKELPKKGGKLAITGKELSGCKEILTINFTGESLEKKDTFGKSDPFLVFYRISADGIESPVHKTAHIKNNLNPKWDPVVIPARLLCGGNYDSKFKIECNDFDSNEKHDLIGECFTTLNALKDSKPMSLINPKKVSKKNYVNSGLLSAQIMSIYEEKSFLDYIRQGVQLQFTVSIDFTASNGKPEDSTSLHYLHPETDNDYILTIKSIGELLEDYDTDKLIPALGFGGRIPPEGKTSHEFFLNGSNKDPYCKGVAGVLEAYQHSLKTVQLFGPTNFAPTIHHIAKFAKKYADGKHYFILLIITDGVISDLPETMNALIDASALAMSVVIVGVGNEDFSAMKILDADDKILTYDGRKAERDIVQFIEFNKFRTESKLVTQGALGKAILKEVPQQLVDYMRKINK